MSLTFGQLIRQARNNKQLSQRELANSVGINYTYLSKLENDRAGTPPSAEVIQKIAEHLELNPQELLYLSGRITEEDSQIFENFIKINYKYMAKFFKEMKNNPNFAEKLVN